jgi:hypothetical protein
MTNPDHDTDPSTPGAKRLSDPRTRVAGASSPPPQDGSSPGPIRAGQPTTDPGVAPPPEPLPVPLRPIGIVVPAVSARANDSVDVLLDGIARDQRERPRTTSQSGGAPAAVYHVEHAVRAARALREEEPKVVVDRPQLSQTIRTERPSHYPEMIDLKGWNDATVTSTRPLAWRVFVAVVAGLGVVGAIFFALERNAKQRLIEDQQVPSAARLALPVEPGRPTLSAAAAPASAAAQPQPPVEVLAPPPALGSAVFVPVESDAATPVADSAAMRRASGAGKPPKPKPRPMPPAKGKADELGEFKTSF